MSDSFRVTLVAVGPNITRVIARVRHQVGLPPAECKRLALVGNLVVSELASRHEAVQLAEELRVLGATVSIDLALSCFIGEKVDDDNTTATKEIHEDELIVDLICGRESGGAVRVRHTRTGESVGRQLAGADVAAVKRDLLAILTQRVVAARLARTVDGVRLPPDWSLLDHKSALPLEAELAREVPVGHILRSKPAVAVAKRTRRDDVLFRADGATSKRIAVVHLTRAVETVPTLPSTVIYESSAAFVESYADEFLL